MVLSGQIRKSALIFASLFAEESINSPTPCQSPRSVFHVLGERVRMHRDFGMIVVAEKVRAFHVDGSITKRRAFGGAGNDTNVVGHDLILQRRHDLTDSCCGFAKLTALPVLQPQNPFPVIDDVVGKLTRWIRFLEKAEGGSIWEGTHARVGQI